MSRESTKNFRGLSTSRDINSKFSGFLSVDGLTSLGLTSKTLKTDMKSIYELTIDKYLEWKKLNKDYPDISKLNLTLTVTNSDISKITALWPRLVYVYVEHLVTDVARSFPERWKIKSLTFDENFNQSIGPGVLPSTLKQLTFGEAFNASICKLPGTLTHLTFGIDFNQPIVLPDSLTHLTFGCWFDQPIQLPKSLTHLEFGTDFNQPVVLPDSLIELTFGYNYRQQIQLPLPPSLVKITVCHDFFEKNATLFWNGEFVKTKMKAFPWGAMFEKKRIL